MQKVNRADLEKAPADGMVRVKILKFVGEFVPGDVVDCSKDKAEHLCAKAKLSGGGDQLHDHVRAIKLSEAKELESKEVDLRTLSQHELTELGKKNVVPTPSDKEFEAQLEKLRARDKTEPGSEAAIDGQEFEPPVGDGQSEPPSGKKFSKKGKQVQAEV